MARRIVAAALVGVVFVVVGCQGSGPLSPVSRDQPILSGVPADGNGNKFILDFDVDSTITCISGDEISRNDSGWLQGRGFGPPNNRNVELDVFHGVATFTNEDGDTFVWRDVGPDLYYVDDGDLFVTITGRSTASGNTDRDEIVIGHVVIRDPFGPTAEVVFIAGNEFGNLDDLACDELT